METQSELSYRELAKPGCRKCNGVGHTGYMVVQPPGSLNTSDAERKPIACTCVLKNYGKVRTAIVRKETRGRLLSAISMVKAPWWKKAWWRVKTIFITSGLSNKHIHRVRVTP